MRSKRFTFIVLWILSYKSAIRNMQNSSAVHMVEKSTAKQIQKVRDKDTFTIFK